MAKTTIIDAILLLKDEFTNPIKGIEQSTIRSIRSIERQGRSIERVGKNISKAGATLTKTISLPIIAAGVASTKLSMEFSDSMAQVATIADTAQVPMKNLKNAVLELSDKTGQSAKTLAEGMYEALSSGIETADVVSFLKNATLGAKAGFTDTATSVDGLTTVINAYGLSAGKARDLTNQMLVAQDLGKTTLGEMAGSIGRVAPTAAALNVNTKELFSSLAVLTATGIKTTESVTGINSALSSIFKPSDRATKAAEALGIQFDTMALKKKGLLPFLQEVRTKLKNAAPEYVKAVDNVSKYTQALEKERTAHGTGTKLYKDLQANLKASKEKVSALEKSQKGNIESLATLFGNVRGVNAVLTMTSKQGIELYNSSMAEMNSKTDRVTANVKKLETEGEVMRKAFNKLQNAGIRFGDTLAPSVAKLAKWFGNLVDRFSELEPRQREQIVQWALIVAAIGPCVSIIGKSIAIFGALLKNWGNVVAGAKAIGRAFVFVRDKAILMNTVIKSGIEHVKNIAIALGKNVGRFFSTAVTGAKSAMLAIKNLTQVVIANTAAFLKNTVVLAKQKIALVANRVAIIAQTVAQKAANIVQGIWNALCAVNPITWIILGVVALIAMIALLVKNWDNICKKFPVVGTIFEGIKTVAVNVFNSIWSVIKAVVGFIINYFKTLFNIYKTIYLSLWKITKTVFTSTWNIVKNVFSNMVSIGKSAIGIVANTFKSVGGVVKNVFANVWNTINGVIEKIKDGFNGIKNFFGTIWEGISNVFKGGINGLIEKLNGFSVVIPNWVPNVGGQTFGFNIPMLANGTKNFPGGAAIVGEKGPELVTLPKGTQVFSNNVTNRILNNDTPTTSNSSKGANTTKSIVIQKIADVIHVREDSDIEKIVDATIKRITDLLEGGNVPEGEYA